MPGYLLATIKITDPEAYKLYTAQTPGVVAKFGGRFLVRGGNPAFVEGEWPQDRIIILEFKDRATAEAFYHSPEYQKIIPLRLAASEGRSVLLDGYSPPS